MLVFLYSEFPLVDEKGIDLKPNTLTQVGIQETEIVRADQPYGWDNCTLDWEDENYPETTKYEPKLLYSIAVRTEEQGNTYLTLLGGDFVIHTGIKREELILGHGIVTSLCDCWPSCESSHCLKINFYFDLTKEPCIK